MSKKTFYIILIIVISLSIIGGLIWYFILKPEEIAAPSSSVDFTVPGQTKTETNLRVISEGPVISLRDSNGLILFYDFSGQLWQLNPGELKAVLSGQAPTLNLAEIIWPKVISADGKKAVYQKNNGLFASDPSGNNQKTLIGELKLKDVVLNWPAANKISLLSKPSGLAVGGLWFLDTRNLNLSKVIDDFGLEVLFAPDGGSFIYSYTGENGRDLKLGVYDKKGIEKVINNISTLIDKCVWAKDQINIYCAVPKLWPDFAVLPDDYYKNAFLTNDDVWKINTETGEKILIAKDMGSISNLIVSEDETNLFFISKENQFLYKLDIK